MLKAWKQLIFTACLLLGASAANGQQTYAIPLDEYSDASWGQGPSFVKNATPHLWMGKEGYIDYTFESSRSGTATVTARLSSELPNRTSTNPLDGSDVIVTVNGKQYAVTRVIPDDGKGQIYQWRVKVLEGKNKIGFAVVEGLINGLCIYSPITIAI